MPGITVDDYITATSGVVRQMIEAARELVRNAAPHVDEVMKYGAPVYLAPTGTPEVYLYAGRDHVNIGFLHGVLLDDPEGLLKGTGKEGRHISFYDPDELFNPGVLALVRAALSLPS